MTPLCGDDGNRASLYNENGIIYRKDSYGFLIHHIPAMKLQYEIFGLAGRLLCPPRRMQRIHHHQEVEINHVYAGSVTYLHRGGLRTVRAGETVLFWGADPHTLVEAEGTSKMAWVTVPMPMVRAWGLPGGLMKKLLAGSWLKPATPALLGEQILRWVDELDQKSGRHRRALELELQAAFWRMAAGRGRGHLADCGASAQGSMRHLEAMARYIAAHYAEELDAVRVAGAAGLNPQYAMILFKKLGGMTMRDYLLQHRLCHAQRLLLEEAESVAEVARESGFQSVSAFYRVFRQAMGCTPLAYIRRMRPESARRPEGRGA